MGRNPFEVVFSAEFENLQEENLDFYMLGIQRTNSLSWHFNPWHHRLINWLLVKLTPSPRKVVYDEKYIGNERRKAGRLHQIVNDRVAAVKVLLMTRTQEILIEG